MAGLIEIVGKTAKQPYYVREMAVEIFTIEELCYLVYHNWYVLDSSFMKEELEQVIDEQFGLPEMAKQLGAIRKTRGSFTEYLAVLLQNTGFCSKEELRLLLMTMQDAMGNGMPQRRKAKGDFLLANHKYMAALKEYQYLLENCQLSWRQMGDIYHNMGTIYARVFSYEEAMKYYQLSYLQTNDPTIVREMLACCMLAGDSSFEKKIPDGDWETEKIYVQEYKRELEISEKKCQVHEFIKEMQKKKDSGQIGTYYDGMKGLLEEIKKEYRRSMEI